jgi:hypothetical protein
MSEKPDSDEFDEDDADEVVDSDDPRLEHLIKDLEAQKRRGAKGAEPAWRRLEKYMEQKRTAELLSDFDDYDIGDGPPAEAPPKARPKRARR